MPDFLRHGASGLRDRLMMLLFGPLLVLFLLSLPGDYKLALEPTDAAYDHALANSAVAVASRVVARGGEIQVDLSGAAETMLLTDRVDRIYYSVVGPDGRRLAGNAPLIPAGDEPESPVFSEAVVLGEKLRQVSVFHRTAAGRVAVVVAETRGKREDTASRMAVAMMLPNMILIIATMGIIYFAVRLALRPLDRLGEEIGRRSPHDLRPLPEDDSPLEARPLVAAINGLIADLRTAAAAQQAFLADAAHQLRTPLAGLQTQLELAAQDIPPGQRARITRISEATQRLGHLTHQLLSLARSGPDADLGHERQRVELGGLLEEIAPRFMDQALARNMDLGVEAQPVAIDASRWMLSEMVSNLLDNAIRYGAGGGTVTARSGTTDEGHAFIEVEDDGPGIRPEDRTRIFERFFRAADAGGTGTGLGLAIVREVADRHEAVITVGAGEGGKGTRIRVVFPAAG